MPITQDASKGGVSSRRCKNEWESTNSAGDSVIQTTAKEPAPTRPETPAAPRVRAGGRGRPTSADRSHDSHRGFYSKHREDSAGPASRARTISNPCSAAPGSRSRGGQDDDTVSLGPGRVLSRCTCACARGRVIGAWPAHVLSNE